MSRLKKIFLLSLFIPFKGFALVCPEMPKQTAKDAEFKVKTEVAKIGPLKGPELEVSVKNATRDLLSTLPAADKIYLEQMMFSAYCSSLQAAAMTEADKAIQIFEYRKFLQKSVQENSKEEKIKSSSSEADIFSKNIGVGSFGEGIESIEKKGISTEISKKKNGSLFMLYKANALEEHWNAEQLLDNNGGASSFWLTKQTFAFYDNKDDGSGKKRTERVRDNCSRERIKAFASKIIQMYGQPNDVEPRKSESYGSERKNIWEKLNNIETSGGIWRNPDGSILLLTMKSETENIDYINGDKYVTNQYCEIHICGWKKNEYRYCPRIDGINL